jgi:FtsP/CotA-like multicopper oxidase with cupredoxin domain
VTHTDGNPLEQPVNVDALPIAPAERYDVVIVADRPGAWILTCLAPGHRGAGEQVLLVYEGHEGDRAQTPDEGLAGLDLWQYGLGRGRDILPPPSGRERAYDLALSGGMMGSDVWTINGKQYPKTDPLSLRRGDRARVRFVNHSMEGHPMHLHGQSFKVVGVNGARYAQGIVKDSVDVEPHMGSVVLEFTAHNPGDWFFHCHKPMHMEGGMITLARIG